MQLVEKILKTYGEKTSVLCIGPAGENMAERGLDTGI